MTKSQSFSSKELPAGSVFAKLDLTRSEGLDFELVWINLDLLFFAFATFPLIESVQISSIFLYKSL
jgi:hypothetical protein